MKKEWEQHEDNSFVRSLPQVVVIIGFPGKAGTTLSNSR